MDFDEDDEQINSLAYQSKGKLEDYTPDEQIDSMGNINNGIKKVKWR